MAFRSSEPVNDLVNSSPEQNERKFIVVGAATASIYALNCLLRWIHGPGQQGLIMDILTWGILIGLSVLYWIGFQRLKKIDPERLRAAFLIAIFAGIFSIVSIATPPWDSTDVFVYAGSGWEQARYGLNPYTHTFRAINGWEQDPMISNEWMKQNRNQWLDLPFVYGFLFALQCRVVALLGQGNLWLTVFLFKFVNLFVHVFLAGLLWFDAERIGGTKSAIAIYLYTWNPMVLLQHIANAHNDIVVGALIALCAVLLYQNRFVWVLPALVAAALIKYVVLCLVPFALLYLWKAGGPRKTALSLLASLLLAVAVAAPYLSEAEQYRYEAILAQLSETTGSFHAFMLRIVHIVVPGLDLSIVERIFQFIGAVAIITFLSYRLYVFSRWDRYTAQSFIREGSWVLIAVFACSSKFWAWYLGMVLPLSLLATTHDAIRPLNIGLSVGHLAEFTGLRRKAIGYFVVTTLVPIILVYHKTRRHRSGSVA